MAASATESKKWDGVVAFIDRIKFEGPPDVLVWKWHSDKGKSDEIRLGAQLIAGQILELETWKKIIHANIVQLREVFLTKDFNDDQPCIYS